ncbi:MAG: hypothetical protein K6E39_04545, partial [Lachnospiraceae bacterium]|nr:hypothetical protein [Lachnospiraceae bacterium]
MGSLRYFFTTRKSGIHEFYAESLRRMSVMEKLHDSDSESVKTFAAWSKRYHEISKAVHDEYDISEERLEKYIYPILDGRIPMTHRLAHILVEEIRLALKEECRDTLITADVLKVIVKFYEEHQPKNVEDYLMALFLIADCCLSFGIDEKFREAVEYYTMAIS